MLSKIGNGGAGFEEISVEFLMPKGHAGGDASGLKLRMLCRR